MASCQFRKTHQVQENLSLLTIIRMRLRLTGTVSCTPIFKARPEEKMKGIVFMPAEAAKERVGRGVRKLKHVIKALISL